MTPYQHYTVTLHTQPQPWDCTECTETQPGDAERNHWKRDDSEVFWTGCKPWAGPACEACWTKYDNAEDGGEEGDPAGPRCDALHRMETARQIKR